MTSPPYWGLRDYGVDGQIGLEGSLDDYIGELCGLFEMIHLALKDTGTVWLNLGDSYVGGGRGNYGDGLSVRSHQTHAEGFWKADTLRSTGLKAKDLIGVPWRVAFELQKEGWYLRRDIIWSKPNPMPESVTDRPTSAHEYIFLLTKRPHYFYNAVEAREGALYYGPNGAPETTEGQYNSRQGEMAGRAGERPRGPYDRNMRSVWPITVQPLADAHFATFPEELVERCLIAGCPHDGVVLDPFFGSGTTGIVARDLGLQAVGIELNPDYIEIASRRAARHTHRRLRRTQLTLEVAEDAPDGHDRNQLVLDADPSEGDGPPEAA